MLIPCLLFFLFIFPEVSQAQTNTGYCKGFDQALSQASKFRKLKVKNEVKCEEISKQGFSDLMKKTYSKSLNLKNEEIAYKMTGFIPQSYQYAKCYYEDNLESVSASYFPSKKTVFLPKEATSELLVHEATHALQDQHFDLVSLSKKTAISTDSVLAFTAVAEGDAELVEREFSKSKFSKNNKSNYVPEKKIEKSKCTIPQSIIFQLDFPYFWGTRYLKKLENTNKAFSDYPKHTTQILYPKKDFNFKAVEKKEVLKFALANQKKLETEPVYEDSWGEYTLRCLLRELLGPTKALIAAKGWLGDKILVLKSKDKGYVTSWVFNLETKKDVKELFIALAKSVEKRFPESKFFKEGFKQGSNRISYGDSFYTKIILEKDISNKKIRFLVSDIK